jgi:hypothetical protein
MFSEVTPEGITETPLGQTLLNGNNIAMVSPPYVGFDRGKYTKLIKSVNPRWTRS